MLNRFVELKQKWTKSEFISVDVVPVLGKCFDDVVNVIMFGEDDPAKVPMVHDMPLTMAIEHAMQH